MFRALSTLIAALFICAPAWGDAINSGYTLSVGCQPSAADGAEYGFQAAKNDGFSIKDGRCRRTPTNFTEISFSSSVGGQVRTNRLFALHTAGLMITPPFLSTEFQPIFTVDAWCPVASALMNWIYVQWNDGAVTLSHTYLMGTAETTASGGVTLKTQYDIDGTLYWSGSTLMSSGGCTDGVTQAYGTNNLGGMLYWTASDGGVFKTNPGKATFFLPSQTVTPSGLGFNKSFEGITFDSSTSNSANDVRNVRAVSDASGKVFTIQPYSDPETGQIDTGVTGYTDTITLTAFNKPKPGMLLGTVKRTGTICSAPPCVGRVVCIARTMGGSGTKMMCSGESPDNVSIPYNITLTRPLSCPAGFVRVAKDNPAQVYDDFCVAKYEMKNVGGNAVSESAGTPWVNVTRSEAAAACRALGTGYDLISRAEWQAIAHGIEDAYEGGHYVNWSNGSKSGDNFINEGHSDGDPNAALSADADNYPCAGTTHSSCANATHPDFAQKRTHKLSTGKIIWDFSGNVSEWIQDTISYPLGSDVYLASDFLSPGEKIKWGPRGNYWGNSPNPKYNSPYGFLGHGNFTASGTAVRGGGWSNSLLAGIYSTHFGYSPQTRSAGVGFRCTYHTTLVQKPAALAFSSSGWDAGALEPNQSTSVGIQLTNDGPSEATITAPLAVTGSYFSLGATNCPGVGGTLQPGATCDLQLTFAPSTVGYFSGALSIQWSSLGILGIQTTVIPVSGIGRLVAASLEIQGNGVFDPVANQSAGLVYLTLVNNSSNPATLGSPAIVVNGSEMTFAGGDCGDGSILEGNATCTLVVRFAPTSLGHVDGTVEAYWSDGAGSNSTSLNLSADSVTPGSFALPWVAPEGIDFGNLPLGTVDYKWILVQNLGGARAWFGTPFASVSGSGMSVIADSCFDGYGLGFMDGCAFAVAFSPSTAGPVSGTLTVNWTADGAGVEQISVPVYGNGVAPSQVSFSGGFDAGGVTIGSSVSTEITVSFSSSFATSVALSQLDVSGDGMSITGGTCLATNTLTVGSPCTLNLQFAPSHTGPASGYLVVGWWEKSLWRSGSVSVSGFGADPSLVLAYDHYSDPAQAVLDVAGTLDGKGIEVERSEEGGPWVRVLLTQYATSTVAVQLTEGKHTTYRVRLFTGDVNTCLSGGCSYSSYSNTVDVFVPWVGPIITMTPGDVLPHTDIMPWDSPKTFTLTNTGPADAILPIAGTYSNWNPDLGGINLGVGYTTGQFELLGNTCGYVAGAQAGVIPAYGSCEITISYNGAYFGGAGDVLLVMWSWGSRTWGGQVSTQLVGCNEYGYCGHTDP